VNEDKATRYHRLRRRARRRDGERGCKIASDHAHTRKRGRKADPAIAQAHRTAKLTREIERLLQLRRIEVVERPTDQAFVCVHSLESFRDGFHCFSYLLPIDQKDAFLSDAGWDLRNDYFRPSIQAEERTVDGRRERRVFYMSRGNELGAEAIVRERFYWKNYPSEIEVAEGTRPMGFAPRSSRSRLRIVAASPHHADYTSRPDFGRACSIARSLRGLS
jgi:hypothetical protein